MRSFVTLLAACLVLAASPCSAEPSTDSNRELTNLRVFARVYGYLRFFYPDERMASLDWDRLAVSSLAEARGARDDAELRKILLQTWQPVAPEFRLLLGAEAAPANSTEVGRAQEEPLLFWQYHGIKLSERQGPYLQRFVDSGEKSGAHQPLFQPEAPPRLLKAQLTPELRLEMPLTVTRRENEERSHSLAPAFAALSAKLDSLDLKQAPASDWRIPVAGILSAWNVFQHFHPYLDQIGADWEKALETALRETMDSQNPEDYQRALMRMIAASHDGHGYVYGITYNSGGLPIRITRCGSQLVISGSLQEDLFRKGDQLLTVDGVDALTVLEQVKARTPGSPQLSEYRALNQFGAGPVGSIVHVGLLRSGNHMTVDFMRTAERRNYFFNPVPEFQFPAFAELRPGVYYLNLYHCGAALLSEKMPLLAQAEGLIIDWRWDGHKIPEGTEMISPHTDIVPHLIDNEVQASPMLIPLIVQPDRRGWRYDENTWPISPKAPRIKARIVFINEPSTVSYGETCMAVIADYHLATLVGAPTAGCNGNANFIPLPGGLRAMWTGMDVRKHDHSPFYLRGFTPDHPVSRTLEGVIAGRDEFLAAAIAAIETPQLNPAGAD